MAASAAMAIGVDAAWQSGLAGRPDSNTSALQSTCTPCHHCVWLSVEIQPLLASHGCGKVTENLIF